MIPADILKKIKRINITTMRLATSVFAGEYKSVFKGRGLEFDEVREYQVGDEIRMIDWNVTARAGKPFVKRYIEERELTIMILLDASRSNYFGSVNHLKNEIAAEITAIIAACARKNSDRVGLIIFTDKIEKFVPARKGRYHVLRIIREALYYKSSGKGTDIPLSLDFLNQVTTRSSIVFVISDFYVSGLKKPLSIANKRHDVVAIRITDPRDMELPDVGVIALNDAETGKRYFLDTSDKKLRDKFKSDAKKRSDEIQSIFRSTKIDAIDISTVAPYTESLIEFFRKRKTRRGIRG